MVQENNQFQAEKLFQTAKKSTIEALSAVNQAWNSETGDGWQAAGLIHATIPKKGTTGERVDAIQSKVSLRLATEKTWRLQDKLLSLTLALTVVAGITSTIISRKPLDPVQNTVQYVELLQSVDAYKFDLFLKLVFGLGAAAAFKRLGVPFLMRSLDVETEKNEAKSITDRVFRRELPANTPEDLADPYRHGLFTSDLLPISSLLVRGDLSNNEDARVALRWNANAVSVALAVAAFPSVVTVIGGVALALGRGVFKTETFKKLLVSPAKPNKFIIGGLQAAGLLTLPYSVLGLIYTSTVIVLRWMIRNIPAGMSPEQFRALELDGAGGAEHVIYTQAGGRGYARRIENSRILQIERAANDNSPYFELGTATGFLAGRHDPYAPSEGLSFGLSLLDLYRHLIVFGGTGSGKTAAVLRPIINQALRLAGLGVLILDGKGSLGSEFDGVGGVCLVDPCNTTLSLVGGLTPALLVDTLAYIYQPNVSGDEVHWITEGKALMTKAAELCYFLGGEHWTLSNIVKTFTRQDHRDKIIQLITEGDKEITHDIAEVIRFFRLDWDKRGNDDKHKIGTIEAARGFVLEFEKYPELRRWMDATADEDTVDIMQVLTGGRVALNIPEYRFFKAGAGITALIKARIFAGIRERHNGIKPGETPVLLVADEVQEVLTRDDAVMLPIARSLLLTVVAATQTIEGVAARLKDMATQWLEVFGSEGVLQNSSYPCSVTLRKHLPFLNSRAFIW